MTDVLSQLLLTAQPATAAFTGSGLGEPSDAGADDAAPTSLFASLLGRQLEPLSVIVSDIRMALGGTAASPGNSPPGEPGAAEGVDPAAKPAPIDISALITTLGVAVAQTTPAPDAEVAATGALATTALPALPTFAAPDLGAPSEPVEVSQAANGITRPTKEAAAVPHTAPERFLPSALPGPAESGSGPLPVARPTPAAAAEIAAAPGGSISALPAGFAARIVRAADVSAEPSPVAPPESQASDTSGQREVTPFQALPGAHRAPPSAESPLLLRVQAPAGAPHWGHEVGQRLIWLSSQDGGRAELVLTPPQLGRIEVSLSMNGDQASAQFVAPHPGAREFLEQALPRLREQLAEAGITLGQASVDAESPRRESQDPAPRSGFLARAGSDAESPVAPAVARRIGLGLIDTFA